MDDSVRALVAAGGVAFGLGLVLALAGAWLMGPLRAGIGASFFAGLALCQVLMRLFAVFAGARLGTTIAFAVISGLAGASLVRKAEFAKRLGRAAPPILVLVLAASAFTSAYWLSFPGSPDDVMTCIGSLHSGRYAGLAAWIVEHDRVPRLGQNYGQALIATVPTRFGFDAPLAALHVWLAMTLAMFAVQLYEFFRARLGGGVGRSVLGAFVVLFCNIALSATLVQVIDSGSPFAMAGYSDVFLGLGTWMIFVELVGSTLRGERLARVLPGVVCFALVWNQSALQNVLLGGIGLVAAVIWAWRTCCHAIRNVVLVTVAFCLAAACGATLGGAFTPRAWHEYPNVPGLDEVGGRLGLFPGQPYRTSPLGQARWWNHLDSPRDPALIDEARAVGRDEVVRSLLFRIERRTWDALRILFWPVLGIVALACVSGGHLDHRLWSAAAALKLAAGFVGCFTFMVGFIKWELTRFELPGILMGLVALVLAADTLAARLPRLVGKTVVAAAVVLATIGPVSETTLFLAKSLRDPAQRAERQVRWSALARPGEELAARYRAFDAAKPKEKKPDVR